MSGAVVILAIMSRYKRVFREAGATSSATAIFPEQHGIRNSILFNKMVREGIFVPVGDGRYYMDEVREAEMQKNRRKLVMIMVAILVIGLIIGFFSLRSRQ